jgi:protein-disulfide isomerase
VLKINKSSGLSFLSALLGGMLLLSWGCDGLRKKTLDTNVESKKVKSDTQKTGLCGEYAEELCKVVNSNSTTCRSVKTTLELMPEAACKAGLADLGFSKGKFKEIKKVCDDLVEKICKGIGPETKSCEMVRNQTKNFPPDRCKSMTAQIPRIVADLKKREEMNKPLDEEKQKMIAEGSGPAFGPKNSKIVLVEFSDFECPYCSRGATALNEIKKKYANKVRVVFRQFPLSFHKKAHLAAQASLAAHEQGKFWEYHDLLFKNQKAIARDDLEKYARDLGLDAAKFNNALENGTYKKAVDDDINLGKKVNVRGTPSLFLNGDRVENPSDSKDLCEKIDTLLVQ